jgi:predicted nucleic acid-binding protein
MLLIDSQIWIYYLDPNASENHIVEPWMDDILDHDTMLINAIIPMEIAHNMFVVKNDRTKLLSQKTSDFINTLIIAENSLFVDIDQALVVAALHLLKDLRGNGIGGRDALIIASMQRHHVNTIATHDKNMLKLTQFIRIDPAASPFLKLDIGEEYHG